MTLGVDGVASQSTGTEESSSRWWCGIPPACASWDSQFPMVADFLETQNTVGTVASWWNWTKLAICDLEWFGADPDKFTCLFSSNPHLVPVVPMKCPSNESTRAPCYARTPFQPSAWDECQPQTYNWLTGWSPKLVIIQTEHYLPYEPPGGVKPLWAIGTLPDSEHCDQFWGCFLGNFIVFIPFPPPFPHVLQLPAVPGASVVRLPPAADSEPPPRRPAAPAGPAPPAKPAGHGWQVYHDWTSYYYSYNYIYIYIYMYICICIYMYIYIWCILLCNAWCIF